MTVTDTPAVRKAPGRLEALAADLGGRGFVTRIFDGGRHPGVSVINPKATQLCENVYAAPAGDGSVWFWWSWAERLAPIDDVDGAAVKIAHVLTPQDLAGRGQRRCRSQRKRRESRRLPERR